MNNLKKEGFFNNKKFNLNNKKLIENSFFKI